MNTFITESRRELEEKRPQVYCGCDRFELSSIRNSKGTTVGIAVGMLNQRDARIHHIDKWPIASAVFSSPTMAVLPGSTY